MNKFITTILICAGSLLAVYAQEEVVIKKDNLSTLYRSAQKAELAGEYEMAAKIYKSILFIDMEQPIPYLKMANMCAAKPDTPESVVMGIAMYEKYLSLAPNSSEREVIMNKVTALRQLATENGWQQNTVDLTAVIQSGQKETQGIIMDAVHPAQNATTKEEIVQLVDDVNDLYDKAQATMNSNNIEARTAYLKQIIKQADPSDPVYTQANMMLAETYGNQGDMQKMKDALTALEDNIEKNKKLAQYYNYALKDATPFEEDICGIWVSDLAYDENAVPYVVLEIGKDEEEGYNVKILPYCTLAKIHEMYTGKPFAYSPQLSRAKGFKYFALASGFKMSIEDNIVGFFFGDENFRGTDPFVAQAIIKPAIGIVTNITEQAVHAVYTDLNRSSMNAQLTGAAIEMGGLLANIGLTMLTSSKKTTTVYNANMQQLFPGCAELNLIKTTIVEKSTGNDTEAVDTMFLRMYKLYPDYNVVFAADGNELFGYKKFSKEEILSMKEYEYLQALKSKKYFNKQSYSQLEQKITDFCWLKASENPNFKKMIYECNMRFKYATDGLYEDKVVNRQGSFSGWMDLSGRLNGLGSCSLNSGYKYIGNWENHKYSGRGKLSTYCPSHLSPKKCPPYEEYTGFFKDGKFHGKGEYRNDNTVYEGDFADGKFHGEGKIARQFDAVINNQTEKGYKHYEGHFVNGKYEGQGKLTDMNGDEFEGVWKKGYLIKGTARYSNGDIYTGMFKYVKSKNPTLEKEVMLPHGEGVMEYTTGEKAAGKWKNGKYMAKNNNQNKK